MEVGFAARLEPPGRAQPSRTRRGYGLLGLLAVALVAWAIAPAVSVAKTKRDAAAPQAHSVAKALRAQLGARTDAPVVKSSCHLQRTAWHCSWAQRTTANGWAYSCKGRAILRGQSWRIDPCELSAELAPVRAPHDVIFGFNDDWGQHHDKLDYAAEAGGEVIRFPLGWNSVQPTHRLLFDWDYYDRLYREAKRKRLRILLSLQDAPCWSYDAPIFCTDETGGSVPDPQHMEAMAAFLKEAIRRYPDAIAVEIYNEPNLNPYWVGPPDPEYYTQLLKVGYEATKSVRPDLPVLFAGLIPLNATNETRMNYKEFLSRAYEAGAKGYFDALSLHPYPRPFFRDDYVKQVRGYLAAFKTIAFRYGDPKIPLWISEIGLSTVGSDGVSEADQAERIATLYDTLRRVPQVQAVIVHRMFDTDGKGNSEDGWGLVRKDLQVKPGYCRLAELNGRSASRC
jgi:polysaccharide biosynthesis protein PslG